MTSSLKKIIYFTVFIAFISIHAYASQPFETWLDGLKTEALNAGISPEIVHQALDDIKPIPRVIELDRKQPEGRLSFAQYKKNVINQARIDKGRKMMRTHHRELQAASNKYGVPPQVIVALWGIETSYGENTGGFDVIAALATLAHEGRRHDFFRAELINALKILDEGHIDAAHMRGSWAGAMGQNQFMPSSFHAFAVDGNADGRRDIWTSLPDVFASTANYLSKSGWDADQRWGRQVDAPATVKQTSGGLEQKKKLSQWKAAGVTLPGGAALPSSPDYNASLVLPDGAEGPAYLVYDNYRVIMKWNKSTYFAISVGLLSDLLLQ